MSAIWVLGGTGRTGRAIAARVASAGLDVVLIGRDAARLEAAAGKLGHGVSTLVAEDVPAIIRALSRHAPTVVINTVGPFAETAVPIASACPAGTHYVDLSNELSAAQATLALHNAAVARGQTLVTGAGFGVYATESVVIKLCKDRPAPERLRVDAIASVEAEPGRLGEALAATIVDVLAAGGRRYESGRLVRSRLLGDFETLSLPDGRTVKTAGGASAELEAAQRASTSPYVVAASSLVPTAPALRLLLPPLLTVLRIPSLRNLAKRRLAAIVVKEPASKKPGEQLPSWAHARATWSGGETKDAWLRTGDAMHFTAEVASQVAMALKRGEGRRGAYTPGSLFGADLATRVGAEFVER